MAGKFTSMVLAGAFAVLGLILIGCANSGSEDRPYSLHGEADQSPDRIATADDWSNWPPTDSQP